MTEKSYIVDRILGMKYEYTGAMNAFMFLVSNYEITLTTALDELNVLFEDQEKAFLNAKTTLE